MPEDIHETIIIELYSLLSLLLCEAGLKRSIFAVKVRPFSGEYGGAQKRGSMRACGGGDAYHYSFVVQTNSGTGCKPIVVRASTNTGRPTDLYRSRLPPHGGGGDASGGGGEERRKAVPSGQLSKTR